MEWLGAEGNVIAAASGVPIPLNRYGAATFISFLDAGTQTITLTQHTKDAAGSPDTETALAAITRLHKGPGVGGTWTEVTQTAANTFNLPTDATNDALVYTVKADELSDDNVFVECTADSGILIAILHDPDERRDPESLASSIVY